MKTNETGHYKNVVSLNALKVFAESLGAAYAPQKEVLQLSNLTTFVDEVTALHNAVRDQINTATLSIDNRQLVYKNVKPLSTKVMNTMSSTNVAEGTIKDVKFFNAKIQGTRIKKKAATTDPEKDSGANSVSRQSYDSIYENFRSMNNLLIQDGNYKPNETDVTNDGLSRKENDMLTSSQDVVRQLNDLGNKRISRNARFYLDDDCLIRTARDIKKYIRGKYGVQSDEFAQIKKMGFKNYRIK